jgi:GNAT superfamily N-acetyltransferase
MFKLAFLFIHIYSEIMSDIKIVQANDKKQIRDFVKFQIDLYKDNPYYVPPIIADEVAIFLKDKNPAFEVADAQLFLAYKNGKIVGRIAGIVSHAANKKWGYKNLRFSWIDFIEDYEVAKALLDTVVEWGRAKGMTTMTGPHGFGDFDQQGMLVEGYDKLATMASFYNHPYYVQYMEKYGLTKEIDYVEFWSTTPKPEDVPEKLFRVNDWAIKKNKFKLLQYPKVKDYIGRGNEIFELLEESFQENFGTVPLTQKQKDYYVKKYLMFLNPKLIKVVENEKGQMIGFLITMPNLSKALQKAKGNLFPFGIFHLLKGLRTYEILDFYFAGVRKEYRGKGVDAIMAAEVVKTAMEMGFKNAESNQELEDNNLVQAQWKFFNPVMHKRRRIFKTNI